MLAGSRKILKIPLKFSVLVPVGVTIEKDLSGRNT